MKRLLILLLLAFFLPLAASAEAVPYRQRVTRPDEPIFDEPSYDGGYVATVREAGVYTIVEEAWDGEGNLWGRLKSGAGWIDLTHVRSVEVAALPVSAGFADEGLSEEGNAVVLTVDEGEYAVWIAFRAYEPLTDVRFVSLALTEEGFAIDRVLLRLPALTAEFPLAACVSFPGDMSTYGLQCVDAAGTQRFFTVSISGRNGMLVLEEWPPVGVL